MYVDGLYKHLEQLDGDVVTRETIEMFRENMVNGESFLELSEEYVCELQLEERKPIIQLINSYCPQTAQSFGMSP